MCYPSMRPEPGKTKGEESPHCWGHMYPAREQEVRLRSAVCPAGQHPRGARRPLASPPPRPAAAEPEARASLSLREPGGRRADERRRRAEAADTFLFPLGPRREQTPPVFAKRGGGGLGTVSSDQKPWPRRREGGRPRGRRTHRTKRRADRLEGRGRREEGGKKKIHPSSSPPPGARDRWSQLLLRGRRKMGFRGAHLNSSAQATGTETPAGEGARE